MPFETPELPRKEKLEKKPQFEDFEKKSAEKEKKPENKKLIKPFEEALEAAETSEKLEPDKEVSAEKIKRRLLELAIREGDEKAVEEAKKLPPYFVDWFHDTWVELKNIPNIRDKMEYIKNELRREKLEE